jgi:chitin disaccharide deacetylase
MIRKLVTVIMAVLVAGSVASAQMQPQQPQAQQPASAQPRQGQTVAERLGYPANSRLLVIHADDFGMSHSVNRATIEALKNRWITSASILVPCPWFPEVVKFAKENPDADLGIHLALNSEWTTYRWGPVTPSANVPSLLDKDGYMPLLEPQVYKQVKIDEAEVEMRAQIDRAKAMGINITHLDTHMGTIVGTAPLFGLYMKLGAAYGTPQLLERRPDYQGIKLNPQSILVDRVLGLEPGVSKENWLKAYEDILSPLPPGSYQLIVHLAYDDDEMRGATSDHPDFGAAWRQNDLDMVKSPEFQKFLKDQNFILVSWKQLAKAL